MLDMHAERTRMDREVLDNDNLPVGVRQSDIDDADEAKREDDEQ